MINVKNIKKLTDKNKTVLIRFDLNIPLSSEAPVSDRITRINKTISNLKKLNSKIVILSHLGRPKGKINFDLSLKRILPQLEKSLNQKILFLENCIGEKTLRKIKESKYGDIILLENCRFHKEEEENQDEFAKSLSKLADVYINDAFACSHRSHASIDAITKYLPAYCGDLLSEELLNLSGIIKDPTKPAITIMGGSKISTKISILKSLSVKMDTIIIVGGMANNFIKYEGNNVQKSLIEDGVEKLVSDIIKFSKDNNCKIIIPIDVITAKEVTKDSKSKEVSVDKIGDEEMILDIGPKTIELIKDEIINSKTIFWNGPAGVFEVPPFHKGTYEIARFIGESTEKNIIKSFSGGGDTIAALEMANTKDKFTYVSTGGGALLELLEGKKLPGLVVQNIIE